eukprot:symbB.v1.2.018482.t2/scaffold1464.1/size117165/5
MALAAEAMMTDEECALMMAAKHKELEFLASLLQMRESQIEELQLQLVPLGSARFSGGTTSPHPQGSQGQGPLEAANRQVLKEVQRLRLRMEELEASITEQQDRCNSLASELQKKSAHVEVLEQHIRQICSAQPDPTCGGSEGFWDTTKAILHLLSRYSIGFVMQGWYTLNPEAVTQQESESTLPLNLETTLAALDAAHERIRQQDAELETLRSAVAQVRQLNNFLLAELEQARQLLHSAPSASATSITLAIDTSGIQPEPWTLSHPFGPGASATGSSIPRPFQTGGFSSSSYPQRLEDLPDHVPTLGSAGHSEGQCRPCFYVFSRNGCKFGRSCTYCHLNHA